MPETKWMPKAGDRVRLFMNPLDSISPSGGFMSVREVIKVTKTGALRVPLNDRTVLFRHSTFSGSWTYHLSRWNWIHLEPDYHGDDK